MSEVITTSTLKTLPSITHSFFTRSWGNGGFSGQENESDLFPIRARMMEQMGIPAENLLCCYQIHSTKVITVTDRWPAKNNPQGDAMVTNKRGIALGVLTADCGPVLFADEKAQVIGAAHAGWKGALEGILDNTIVAMEKLGAQRKNIHAALGPCIGPLSYEVGPEFFERFLSQEQKNVNFFKPSSKEGHHLFDLPGYINARLGNLGIGSIEISREDTCATPERFFSYRYATLQGKKRAGNMLSAIAIR